VTAVATLSDGAASLAIDSGSMGGPASQQVIGRYTIYGKIASGGMASVHFGRLAGGAGFSRTVAIKRLHPHLAEDPEFMSTMIDEARLAARIHHPNVVPTLDVVAADGELLLVMEYVRGESLARLVRTEIERGGRVALPIASAIAIGALHGLHAAHEATSDHGAPLGIVHRDVSPQNILVGVDGMARVIDFGVAKAAGRLQTTQEGTIKGKLAYMAPEQIAARPVTRTADVYAMGVVLWELLAGRRLFQGENDAALLKVVLAGAKEPPGCHAPHIPAALDALVMRALAPDPTDRFATTLDMAERLLRLVPPAFSTDVGTWCERAARESIARRGTLLAEIESSSGSGPGPGSFAPEAPSPRASRPDLGLAGAAPSVVDDDMIVADEAPIVATQPSSLSVETPKARPSMAPGVLGRRGLTVTLGAAGGLLVAGLLAVWFLGKEPAPAPAAAAPPAALPPPSPEPTPAVPPPPLSRPASPPSPAPANPLTPPRANPPPKPKPSCIPPYVLDAAGHRQYKPECL